MTRTTNISWAERTWNPITGCTKVSPGCKHCYAETMAQRIVRMGQKSSTRYLPVVRDSRWTGAVHTWPELLDGPGTPLRVRTPTTWFVGSMSDVFHDGVPFEFIAAMFAVMGACPQHRFMLLTKRPENARAFFSWVEWRASANRESPVECCRARFRKKTGGLRMAALATRPHHPGWPLPNVAIGTSAETQEYAHARIPILGEIPAHRRFVSFEPLLGPIEIADWSGIDLAILGCESGQDRRETKLEWIQDLGRSVLDAQVRAVPQVPCPDPEGSGWIEMGPEQRVSGPALHIKQADVCAECAGECVTSDLDGCNVTGCDACGGTELQNGIGVAGKVRGRDPSEELRVYIPGHGTQAWREEIQW